MRPNKVETCHIALFALNSWRGDKKWEKTFKSSACSHWMDSRVTSTQPTVRLWRNWRFQKLVRKLEVQDIYIERERPLELGIRNVINIRFTWCTSWTIPLLGKVNRRQKPLYNYDLFFKRLRAWIKANTLNILLPSESKYQSLIFAMTFSIVVSWAY